MANDLVLPKGFGTPSAALAASAVANDELSSGVVLGFPVLGYRGKVWRVKHRGEEQDLLAENGVDPLPSVELVIVKAADHLSKLYYINGYEGDGASGKRPDCWSNNGITPDAAVEAPQSKSCAVCPMNRFGSGTNGKGKACGDHKRLAVAPLPRPGEPSDVLDNEEGGGPMLLRVPAASLKELPAYVSMLKQANYGYFSVGTRVSFDRGVEFPKLMFTPIRPLSDDDEFVKVKALREDPRVARILSEEPEAGEEPEAKSNVVPFEQAKPPAAPQAAPAPKPSPKPAPAAAAPKASPKPSPIAAALANPAPVRKATAAPAPKPAPVEAAPEEAAEQSSDDALAAIEAEIEGLL